jgi:hypothetical protein
VNDWGVKIEGGWFSEEKHIYRDDKGQIVPSATQVFEVLGMNDFSMVKESDMEWKREYGNAVHKGVELLVFHKLDWETCSEEIIPAITGIECFLNELKYVAEAAEERKIVTINGMKYGMTLDHRGTVWYHGVVRKIVVDVKTGTKASPTWAWQGGGYVPSLTYLFLILQVSKTGKVTPHWIDPVKAQREFLILLAAANLKLNAGLGKIRNVEDGD